MLACMGSALACGGQITTPLRSWFLFVACLKMSTYLQKFFVLVH